MLKYMNYCIWRNYLLDNDLLTSRKSLTFSHLGEILEHLGTYLWFLMIQKHLFKKLTY